MDYNPVALLREAKTLADHTQQALDEYNVDSGPTFSLAPRVGDVKVIDIASDPIYQKLLSISKPLSASYEQVVADLHDSTRISWAGTAHEIREIFSNLLRLLAPNDRVEKQQWYKQEKNIDGPTQKQRARFILEQRGSGSKEQEVVQQLDLIEDRIGSLIRATYSRASDAAHGSKNKQEVDRIYRYFVAFTHDLLDIQ